MRQGGENTKESIEEMPGREIKFLRNFVNNFLGNFGREPLCIAFNNGFTLGCYKLQKNFFQNSAGSGVWEVNLMKLLIKHLNTLNPSFTNFRIPFLSESVGMQVTEFELRFLIETKWKVKLLYLWSIWWHISNILKENKFLRALVEQKNAK